ncbi:armadillo-type protein [Zychaea mexicana]|uniref:armadillo-type protein n=1 Tax=Zychaea mexicana TaxID=64656 RepID=UPI0022FE3722|nr:armadillo-type protein [Zychaea mexicana]KAI9490022.1 armadillo-type protein [Zychaea mexicana]
MQREGSHGGRSRSGRGGKGRHGGKQNQGEDRPEKQQQGAPTIPPEQVVPLEKSENRWVPLALRKQREAAAAAAAGAAGGDSDVMSDEVIIRKVKSLLNKLTLEKFDSIAGQIWEYAKQSEKEDDGRALKVVIQLTFDKACDEPPFAVMWAQLCRKMYDSITDDIKDVGVKDKEGNTVAGVNLLRKYLLNRCQHDFERGWKMQIPDVESISPDMLTDEYYAAVKAKRQGLGLVVFIGELFKRQMLTDRIMLQCLTRLCDNPKEVGDEETETMVKLVSTIGKVLDTSNRRNKEWMDVYFERIRDMLESPNLSSRVKFMIMDLFDLRKNKWVGRRANQPAPTTIAQVHEQAQKAKNEEKEAMKRTTSSRGSLPHPMARAGSHRGAGSRDLQREGSSGGGNNSAANTTVDGWSTVGSGSPGGSTKSSRVNELANFGKTDRSKTRSNVLGPSNSPFASLHRANNKSGGEQKSSPSESRSSSANMFR